MLGVREVGAGRGCPDLGRGNRGYLEEENHAADMAFVGTLAWSRGWESREGYGRADVVATGREEDKEWSRVGVENSSD